jgi:hypothetical protein
MKWIDNLKTGAKLLGGFGVLILMMLAIAGHCFGKRTAAY